MTQVRLLVPRALTLLLLILTVFSIFASAAWAAAEDGEPESYDRVVHLAEAALAGTLTDAEREELQIDYPELAQSLPDATLSEITLRVVDESIAPPDSFSALAAAATRCKRVEGEKHVKSIMGNTVFRYKHAVSFCYDGKKVTSVYNQEDWITEAEAIVVWKGTIEDSISGVNTATAKSFMQGHAQGCYFQHGCLWNLYPWVRLTLHADGRAVSASGA